MAGISVPGRAEDALMQQWALFGATAVEPSALLLMYAHVDGKGGSPEGRAEIAGLVEKLRRPMAVLEAHLAAHGHMVGGRFTVADINMAEIVRYAASDADLMSAYPKVSAWLDALHARPASSACGRSGTPSRSDRGASDRGGRAACLIRAARHRNKRNPSPGGA
jgi:glutathione S-transferase